MDRFRHLLRQDRDSFGLWSREELFFSVTPHKIIYNINYFSNFWPFKDVITTIAEAV